jgi:DNA-binding LacI/PurR family transcriptional regulator
MARRDPSERAGAQRRSTLTDVGRLAGVHSSTVSRALSRPDLVSAETRARVESAVQDLGFAPNPQARGLAAGRTGAIGLLVPDIANPYFAELIRAAQAEAALNDLVLLVADTEHDAEGELRTLRTLQPHVDGVILCTPVAPAHVPGPVPIVYVNRRARGICSVTVDQHVLVRQAFDHLAELGHRHIVWLNGPGAYWSSQERLEAISVLDGRAARHEVVEDIEPNFEGGQKGMDEVLRSAATAVVAFNDLIALGVLVAAASAGLDVPAELSVVGSDDIQAAAMSWPPLTSVASPIDEVGRVAVRSLLRSRRGRRARSSVLSPSLRVRRSTGPPRKAHRGARSG